jgi:hypothetical protein
MSYTSVFGGTTIYPSDVSYLPLALAVDTTLEWPLEASGDITVAARIIGVTPASAGRSVIMPDATRTGTGQSVLFNNMGPTHSFLVKDDAGTILATVAPGTQWQVYLTDNTTAAGTWEVYQMGASTATVQASALAGPGLMVVGSQLAQAALFTQFTTNLSPTAANRATMYVYTGTGAATVSLPTASAVDNKYFVRIRNQGTGVLTVDPAGTDLINGVTSLNLAPEDSAMIICDGLSNWYTVGLGQNAEFTFDFVAIPVSGGTYTLSGAQLNRIAYRFEGTLTSNQTIVVPNTVQQYWVDNRTTGNFTLGVKTASQVSPTLVNQNASAIMYCDGQDVVFADTSMIGVPVAVAQGGTGATTPSGARANLGVSPYADPLVTALNSPAAQAVLFPAPITDGQMLIGNAATPGFAQATLTPGTGIGILNAPGSVTITNTGSPAPGSVYSQLFSGTGSQTAFTLGYQPFSEDNTQVYINGVYQQKNTYSLSGFTLTFSVAPPLGTNNIEVVVIQVVPIGATTANLVTFAPTGNITATDVQSALAGLTASNGSSDIGFAQSGTGAVARTAESKMRESLSVLDFGADPTGATDSTTEIQAALDAAAADPLAIKSVFIPSGVYKVGRLVLPRGSHVYGEGGKSETTAIANTRLVQNANDDIFIFDALLNGSVYFWFGQVSDLTILGSNAYTNGYGLHAIDTLGNNVLFQDQTLFENLSIRAMPQGGINFTSGALPVTVRCCKLLWNGGPGITATRVTQYNGVHFDNISGDGNVGGLIRLSGWTTTDNVLITNLKSEYRVNNVYGGGVGQQPIAIVAANCNNSAITIVGANHISSVPDGAFFEKPGNLIQVSGPNYPQITWNGVIIRVRATDTGSDPYIIGGYSSIYVPPYTVQNGTFGTDFSFYNSRMLMFRSTSTTSATPSVANLNALTMNYAGATTVTNFTDAADGQLLVLLFTTANVTIQQNSDIALATGKDWNAPNNGTLTLAYLGGRWRELSRGYGSNLGTYVPTNVTPDRAFNADQGVFTASATYAQAETQLLSNTVSELADVLGTLISDLTTRGVI